jgi:hypothetical protein
VYFYWHHLVLKEETQTMHEILTQMRQGKDSEVETPPLQKYKRLCLEYLTETQEVAKS